MQKEVEYQTLSIEEQIKAAKVGDTAVFRCGVELPIEARDNSGYPIVIEGVWRCVTGRYRQNGKESPFDIIAIKPSAPVKKPSVRERLEAMRDRYNVMGADPALRDLIDILIEREEAAGAK